MPRQQTSSQCSIGIVATALSRQNLCLQSCDGTGTRTAAVLIALVVVEKRSRVAVQPQDRPVVRGQAEVVIARGCGDEEATVTPREHRRVVSCETTHLGLFRGATPVSLRK